MTQVLRNTLFEVMKEATEDIRQHNNFEVYKDKNGKRRIKDFKL